MAAAMFVSPRLIQFIVWTRLYPFTVAEYVVFDNIRGAACDLNKIAARIPTKHLHRAAGQSANFPPGIDVDCASFFHAAKHAIEIIDNNAKMGTERTFIDKFIQMNLLRAVKFKKLCGKIEIRRNIEFQANQIAIERNASIQIIHQDINVL